MVTELLETIAAGLERGPFWLSILLDASVKATVLLGAAAIANRLLRRSPASARHAVWVAAVASAVILPVLSAVLPAWRLEILPMSQRGAVRAPVAQTLEPVEVMPLASLPPDLHPPRRAPTRYTPLLVVPSGGGARQVIVATPAPSKPAPVASVSVSPAPVVAAAAPVVDSGFELPVSWPVAIALLWVMGAMVFLAKILAGRIGVFRLAKSATPVTRHGWLALNRRLAHKLGITREVLLVESESVALPMTWGIQNPVVLLPASAETWTTDRLELVLLHELSHVRRLDALTQLLAQLTCAFYWFHPLAWIAERRMRALREYACDDQVLAAGNRPSEYAGQILDIVRSVGRRDPHAGATLAMARKSQLEGRLMAILDPQLPRRALGRFGTGAVSLGFLALVVPLATFQPAAVAQTASDRGPLPRLSPQESARRRVEAPPAPAADAMPTPVPPTGEAPAANAAPSAEPSVATMPPAGGPPPMIAGGVCRPEGRSSTNINRHRDGALVFNARRDGKGCMLEVESKGEVALGRGDEAIQLSDGGSFTAEERTDNRTRRFEARTTRSGRLSTTWTVNGSERPVDAEARTFVESMLSELGPNSSRVAIAPRPPRPPEAPRAPEPFVAMSPPTPPSPPDFVTPPAPPAPPAPTRWSYSWNEDGPQEFKAKLEEAKQDEQEAREALARIERSGSSSDSRLAEGLMDVAGEHRMAGENSRQQYLNLAEKIRSSDLRRDVLKKLMGEAPISLDTGRRILSVAKGISSDEALEDVLDYMHRIKEHDLVHGPLAVEYVDAASKIRSDEALADALYNLLHPQAPREAALEAMKLAQRIGSDELRHKVLIEIKDHQNLDREIEAAYLSVANGIRSNSVRAEALEELDEAKGSRSGKRMALVFRNDSGRDHERHAAEMARQAERMAEQAERQAERERERAEREAERAEREAERAAAMAERDAERAARDAERRAQFEQQRSRQVAESEVERFREESRRMAEEARRLKLEAKRLANELKAKASKIKQKFADDLEESNFDEEIDRELERLEESLNE